MIVDLRLEPSGRLNDASGIFAGGNGVGLLRLVGETASGAETPARRYLQRVFTDFVRRLAAMVDPVAPRLAEGFAALEPDPLARLAILDGLPSMLGREYFTDARFTEIYRDFAAAFSEAFAKSGVGFDEFLRSLGPAWKDLGKVSLHLAENKKDETGRRPFAFLATFIYRTGDDGTARHLPLAGALKAFVSQPAAIKNLLGPLERTAETSKLIKDLVESRRIFQPCAFTAAEAYAFLKDTAAFEAAGIVVRLGNLWKKGPQRAKVSVSVGKSAGSLNAHALLDFDFAVTVNGEKLDEEEIRALLNAGDGLVRLRGQWVEADADKIRELLEKWRDAKRLAATEGLSLLEGLRLLSGFGADGKETLTDDPSCEVRTKGELKELLSGLVDPSKLSMPELPENLDAILRPYQKSGVAYLYRTTAAGLGACLADDKGLGKTLQLLALLSLWKRAGTLAEAPALIVVPASLLQNWKDEAARFTPDLKVGVLHPSSLSPAEAKLLESEPKKLCRQFDLVLITYGMLQRSEALRELEFPAVIADEAQAIKNPGTRQSRAVRAVKASRRIALTGTPVENRLTDLWSIFEPDVRGNPESPLRWISKSLVKTRDALNAAGYAISHVTVGKLLRIMGYTLQSCKKALEHCNSPDRDAQFGFIAKTIDEFRANGQPVISVDTKKKELVGNFRNAGRDYRPIGTPHLVEEHDFATDDGRATPYGVKV